MIGLKTSPPHACLQRELQKDMPRAGPMVVHCGRLCQADTWGEVDIRAEIPEKSGDYGLQMLDGRNRVRRRCRRYLPPMASMPDHRVAAWSHNRPDWMRGALDGRRGFLG